MKQEDFEKAKEIENRIAELTLLAEKDIQIAKRIETGNAYVRIEFGLGLGSQTVVMDEGAKKGLSEFYYKRHNDIQRKIGELKTLFDTL